MSKRPRMRYNHRHIVVQQGIFTTSGAPAFTAELSVYEVPWKPYVFRCGHRHHTVNAASRCASSWWPGVPVTAPAHPGDA